MAFILVCNCWFIKFLVALGLALFAYSNYTLYTYWLNFKLWFLVSIGEFIGFRALLGSIQQLRRQIFLTPPHAWTFFTPWAWTKTDIFWPPPPSSCPRSYWMSPLIFFSICLRSWTKSFLAKTDLHICINTGAFWSILLQFRRIAWLEVLKRNGSLWLQIKSY